MPIIGWSQFYKTVRPHFRSKACPVRKAIYTEMKLLESGGDDNWETLLGRVKHSVPVNWGSSGKSLKDSYRKGAGSIEMACAIYFWFHITEGLKSYAKSIDEEIFSDDFETANPGYRFQRSSDFFDYPKVDDIGYSDVIELYNRKDIEAFLEEAQPNDSRYVLIATLLIRLDDIMQTPATKFHKKLDIFTFGNSLTQNEDWISPQHINSEAESILDWRTDYRKPAGCEVFATADSGFYWALIKPNGTRVKSTVLYQLDSWFNLIFQMLDDEVLVPRDLDLFLRGILAFAICGRSDYLNLCFPESRARLGMVLRTALDRARILDFDLRDFKPLDAEYSQYLKFRNR